MVIELAYTPLYFDKFVICYFKIYQGYITWHNITLSEHEGHFVQNDQKQIMSFEQRQRPLEMGKDWKTTNWKCDRNYKHVYIISILAVN